MGGNEMTFLQWRLLIETILCLVSGVLLAITALIYFTIPQTQDIEGKCTFHLIITQCFFYLLCFFQRIAQKNELALVDGFCILHWYMAAFILLSYFTWCAILLYYMSRGVRQNMRTDESKVMNRFKIIGYGIPVLLIVICNIHAHFYSFFTVGDLERDCNAHRNLLNNFYAIMPIVILELLCAFFFVCLQRQLWTVQPTNSPEHSTSSLKKFRFRFILIAKLFIVTGLPWLLFIFFFLLTTLTDSLILFHAMRGINTFITSEGIILFYILVIGRKHVYRGLADRFGITVRRWQQDPDSEESIEHYEEN